MSKSGKTINRAAWIIKHYEALRASYDASQCPIGCRAKCRNGRTCKIASDGGWGYWARALGLAAPEKAWGIKSYWSGMAPTPSISINRAVADYIRAHAPADLL